VFFGANNFYNFGWALNQFFLPTQALWSDKMRGRAPRLMASLIAVTFPQYERRVERALKERGLNCYLPRYRRVASKRTTLLMPRYIFAGPPEAWAEVRKINGVSRLLRKSDNQPALVQDHELAHIRKYEDENGLIKLPRKPRFRRGQRVRITLGALTGLVGIYQGLSRKSREKILLALGEVSLPEGNLILE
jgi:transcription antitermination factor NusG